jgi:hypothetical protein
MEGGEIMELKPGTKVKHKLTGQEMMILEIGPKSKKVPVQTIRGVDLKDQEYLAQGIVRIRLPNMTVVDIYDYEIEGIDPIPETGGKSLLLEN